MKLETYIGFNPDEMADYFERRGWHIQTVPVREVKLVRVQEGASLECGDGRFDQFEKRRLHGIRDLGGINAVMAYLTGGDEVGLLRACELIKRFGATPGTHSAEDGGCGFVDLWMAGDLESAIYPYALHSIDKGGLRIGQWLKAKMRHLGGAHIRLNGDHKEEGVRVNSFRGYTEVAGCGSRFRIDDWFLADLGIPDQVRFFKNAEVIEKLKKNAKKLEIIVP